MRALGTISSSSYGVCRSLNGLGDRSRIRDRSVCDFRICSFLFRLVSLRHSRLIQLATFSVCPLNSLIRAEPVDATANLLGFPKGKGLLPASESHAADLFGCDRHDQFNACPTTYGP